MGCGAGEGPTSGGDVGRVEEGWVAIEELLEGFDEIVLVEVGKVLEG